VFKKVRVQGARKIQGRRVQKVRKGLYFSQQRSKRAFFNTL